jgi:hypothetical protein
MFMQPQIMPIMPSLFLGVFATLIGAYPVLVGLKILGKMAAIDSILTPLILGGILAVAGLALILDSILGFSLA